MNAKISGFLLIFIISFQSSFAQKGAIEGKLVDNMGHPVEGATLSTGNPKRNTISDADGYFILNKLDSGQHILTISFIGSKNQEKPVFVHPGLTTTLSITITADAILLKEVVVSDSKNPNEQQLSASKSGIAVIDLPQTVGAVNHRVISDQQATRVGDVIRNISGVTLTQTRLGVNETYTSRGYSIGITGGVGSILKNGLVSNIAGMPEAATLESVEVMKGSSALLYGNVSGGLVVNLVTKRPKFYRGGEIRIQVGGNSQYKPIIDLFGPLSKKLAFRIVGSYENDRSFRDVVKTERTFVNPSLLYQIGKKTNLLVQGDYLNAKLTPDFGIGTLDSGRILPITIPVSRFINVSWAYNNVHQGSGSFHLDHSFNEKWQLVFSGSAQKTDVDSYGAGLPNIVSKTGDWNRSLARAQSIENDFTSHVNLTGKLSTGKINHQLLVGADATRVITITDAYKVTAYDKINILDPAKYTPRTDMPAEVLLTHTKAPSNRFGVYAQDLLTLTKTLKLLAGLRWSMQQTVQTSIYTAATQANTRGAAVTKNDRAFSPKVAIVYQPATTTSVFASYSNNFTINTGTDIYGSLLKPSIIDQYELGVKNIFLHNKLAVNFSIYRILNNNLAQQAEFRADGSLNSDATVKELKGQTTSDGLEVDINGNFNRHFYVIAGYGYNYMRFTNTSGAKGSNIEGEQVVINPRHTANFSGFYTFHRDVLRNVKLGLSAYYTASRLGGYNNTVGQSQTGSRLLQLTGFTTIDVSLGYQYKKFEVLGKLGNLFDVRNYLVHDNYSVQPITPRQMSISLSYKL